MSTRGTPFVISAPSGTGKTTVCRRAVERDAALSFSVSHTTRPQRSGEKDGVDYHFVTNREFREMVDQGAFVEWAEYSSNLYGTSHAALEAILAIGRDALLEIEVQGAAQVRARREDARFIFLLPPSMKILEARLRGRGTDSAEVIERRLAVAQREILAVERFDYAVVNEDLEEAVAAVLEIIAAERAGATDAVLARFGRAGTVGRLPWLAAALAAG